MGCIEEGVITRVDRYEDDGGTKDGPVKLRWSVGFTNDGGGNFGISLDDRGVEPKVGDTLTLFGGWGYPIHGYALNGVTLHYLTRAQEDQNHAAMVAETDRQREEWFAAHRTELDEAYEALPFHFRMRIDKFRNAKADWRVCFEGYEMATCQLAVEILAHCPDDAAVQAFYDLPWEEQAKAVTDRGYSGNQFGCAVMLARWYYQDPELVVLAHGAMTPLTGCEEYGCVHPYEVSKVEEDA
jgi:hypothetical protein